MAPGADGDLGTDNGHLIWGAESRLASRSSRRLRRGRVHDRRDGLPRHGAARALSRRDRPAHLRARARRHGAAGGGERCGGRCTASSAPAIPTATAWWRCAGTSRVRAWRSGAGATPLAEKIGEIVHGAATVSFSLGLDASRAMNVEGTRQILQFAALCQARGGLRRLSHISTAYVAGEHSGCFSEDDLDVGQSFRNGYERSKFEAERLVAELARPPADHSHAPGHHRGRTRERMDGGLQRPLLAAAGVRARHLLGAPGPARRAGGRRSGGLASRTPSSRSARRRTPRMRRSTSPPGEQASTVGELATLAGGFFGRPAPRLIDPLALPPRGPSGASPRDAGRALRGARCRRSEMFFPYFAIRTDYDDRRARIALRGHGHPPDAAAANTSTG